MKVFNRYEKQSANTKRPVDRAKAAIARESLDGLSVTIRRSQYYEGNYAKVSSQMSKPVEHVHIEPGDPPNQMVDRVTYVDHLGLVIDTATGEIL